MNKEGKWVLWVGVSLIAVLLILTFLYFILFKPNNASVYSGIDIKNPVLLMSDEQALAAFDESFVFYLLYSIEAYNLHNPPLSSDRPKIEVNVDDEIYNAVINKGMINVTKGEILGEDIMIKTSKAEAIIMLRDKNYIAESFESGESEIVLVADKTTLFAKGYLNMYTELTGKSITGNMIRIALD